MKLHFVALMLAVATIAGCGLDGDPSHRPPAPIATADVLALEVSPPTVQNFDDKPGADGFDTRIHFFLQSQAAPVLVSGKLEMSMYEVRDDNIGQAVKQKPLHVWSLPQESLSRFVARSKYGWCYVIRFDWGQSVPKTERIVIQAVYTSPSGAKVASAPLVLVMVPK
ncbi:MAG: hypothetical protein EHM48_06030 [Planctomycetaceae bacterium]|nr:MAG: hypothetical protein EHM48_06030 [Planctomycetaceae bacterium]